MNNREAERILLQALKALQDAARSSLPHEPYSSCGAARIMMYTPYGIVAIDEDGKVSINTLDIPLGEAGYIRKPAERFEKGCVKGGSEEEVWEPDGIEV